MSGRYRDRADDPLVLHSSITMRDDTRVRLMEMYFIRVGERGCCVDIAQCDEMFAPTRDKSHDVSNDETLGVRQRFIHVRSGV